MFLYIVNDGKGKHKKYNKQEGVSKCTHPLFYAQNPDFLKPGLCYFLKFLYL